MTTRTQYEYGSPTASPFQLRPSAYEHRFADLLGGDVAAFGFWKGRVALYAVLRAMGIGPGDEVVMPGFTCVVVPNAVRLTGATPVYADIELSRYNIDPGSVERVLTSRSKAIIAQHTFGAPAALDELLKVAQARELRLIEDCAHTVAGSYHGRRLGTVGDAGFYSFQWSKPYTTGLGGMVVTGDHELAMSLSDIQESFVAPPRAARLRLSIQYRLYSRFFTSRRYWLAQDVLHAVSKLGLFVGSSTESELEGEKPIDHRWRMSAAQQKWGLGLVGSVESRSTHAHALAERYEESLSREGWITPERLPDAPFLRYSLLVANREELVLASRSERIELGTWFESPLHPIAPAVHHVHGYTFGQCPNAEMIARQIVNLPLHLGITFDEADRIAQFFIERATRPDS